MSAIDELPGELTAVADNVVLPPTARSHPDLRNALLAISATRDELVHQILITVVSGDRPPVSVQRP